MFSLTKQERLVLALLAVIVLAGSLLQYALKKWAWMNRFMHFAESDAVYHKVDLNTATFEELEDVPMIGERTAERILEYRRKWGPFQKLEDLRWVPGVGPRNYERIRKFLKVSPNTS